MLNQQIIKPINQTHIIFITIVLLSMLGLSHYLLLDLLQFRKLSLQYGFIGLALVYLAHLFEKDVLVLLAVLLYFGDVYLCAELYLAQTALRLLQNGLTFHYLRLETAEKLTDMLILHLIDDPNSLELVILMLAEHLTLTASGAIALHTEIIQTDPMLTAKFLILLYLDNRINNARYFINKSRAVSELSLDNFAAVGTVIFELQKQVDAMIAVQFRAVRTEDGLLSLGIAYLAVQKLLELSLLFLELLYVFIGMAHLHYYQIIMHSDQ